MFTWMLQSNIVGTGFRWGDERRRLSGEHRHGVNEPSAAETVCAVSSALCTVTVDPAVTVSGLPNAKSLTVIVAGIAGRVDGAEVEGTVGAAVEGDEVRASEPHP